jgi:serine/threonine protein kinase
LASTLVDAAALDAAEGFLRAAFGAAADDPAGWDQALADLLVERGLLTRFQATQMVAGRRKLTLGQYRILDVLGQGGMGQVFRAEHSMMGREVAVKVLPRAKSTPDTEAAFRREIRMLGRLDHPNLVRALDAGHDGKVYYLVTELVAGVDLRKQVLKYGTLDEVAAASVITQVARGLTYAHAQGLVHRDVKPGNILVTPQGIAKLLDVGLAGSVLEAESTRLGRVVGTLDYMAPEQIRSPDTAGPAADIYGLGCTLYFVLAGQVPFPGGTRQEKARRQLNDTPAPLRRFAPDVSAAFLAVVEGMMSKSAAERIGTADEVIDRLRPWTPEEPVAMPRVPRQRSSDPKPALGAAGAAVGSRASASFDQELFDAALPPGLSGGEAAGGPPAAARRRQATAAASEDLAGTLWSDTEETGLSPPPPWEAGQREWGPALESIASQAPWILGVSVAAGLAAGAFVEFISQIDPARVVGWLGKNGSTTLGGLAFLVVLAVQVMATLAAARKGD